MADMVNAASKKTLGRRKIEIKKIEKKTSLQVTFTKRRMGLFRKASELSVLCGAEIAILVKSPAERVFAFGHPSVETLIDRFQRGIALSSGSGTTSSNAKIIVREDGMIRSKYEESVRRLEMERRMLKEKEMSGGDQGTEFWFDEPFEGMELHELEEYVEALEGLKDNVLRRLEEIEKRRLSTTTTSSSSNQLPLFLNQDDQGFGFDHFPAGLPIDQFNDQDFYGRRSPVYEGLKVETGDDGYPLMDTTASGYYI
ncbi:Agamous-like MADS-box protein [Sesamum alatum]|uniref:Agamous-like MADS-box protein n=1 Tax=Sesamum alatum TaxID=300844 RepID=A0AAE1Z1D3_9LAMI|nr:Agamous-like MADS-box protein [Sesamum alatum]